MTNSKDLIREMKRVRDENGYSYGDMRKMMEANGDRPLSDASFSRIFEEDSENKRSFSYDYTLVPLARAILPIETIEENDTEDVKVLKEINKIKHTRIRELELENEKLKEDIDAQKLKYHEKMDAEREAWGRSIDFLKEQISYKDVRMNEFSSRVERLLDMINKKDERIESLVSDLIALKDLKEAAQSCPYRKEKECKNED